jgi:ABC-type transport system substrate-binding protein
MICKKALALIFATACLISACRSGQHQPESASSPGTADQPRRGGKIILLSQNGPDYLDPGLAYLSTSWQILPAAYNGLLSYVKASGAEGMELVPDLASEMPDISLDGRRYTFVVKKGVFFGPPVNREVTAADFKYSIERLIDLDSPGVGFYMNIEGADEMSRGEVDHLRGIQVSGDSLTFHLKEPDAVFLNKLAMPFTYVVPPEVAEEHPRDYSQHSVATGPYMIARYVPRRRIILVRNPSYSGQEGYVDTLEIQLGANTLNAIAKIKKGQADLLLDVMPPSELPRLKGDPRYQDQVRISPIGSLYYIFMNVRMKPFDDLRVRQAVCYAIDKRALLKVWSGQGIIANEIIPPEFPAFEALNLYPGPDLEKARMLLAEAGYPDGFKVDFYASNLDPNPRAAEVVQAQLRQVGIRTTIRLFDSSIYYQLLGRPAEEVPMGLTGWYQDYPDPSNFIDVLFNGNRITSVRNNNVSHYDNPEVNRLIEETLISMNPEIRKQNWRQLDRMITADAPIVPYLHFTNHAFISGRLGGYLYHPSVGTLLTRLYIKGRPAR